MAYNEEPVLQVPSNTEEHVPFNQTSRCCILEDFLTFHASIILITLGIRALAWQKKEKEEEEEKNKLVF